MKYNSKNIKNFLWVKVLILPLLFFVTETKSFIYKIDILVNEMTGQKIICLGDRHKHPDYWKGTKNENITKTQQADIIALANKLHATILLEVVDLENIVLQYSIKEYGRKIIPIMVNILANETIESVLDGLYTHSIANNIRCENIECRIPQNCFNSTKLGVRCKTLQELCDRAEQIARKIAKFNDKELFKKIYKEELDNFNTVYPMLKEFLNKLGKHGNISISELKKLIKNEQISLSDDTLLPLVNFFEATKPVYIPTALNPSYLQPDEIGSLINWTKAFPCEFVDMHALHAIAQNEKTSPIIVVAGGSHTDRIVKRLQQCDYTVEKSIGKGPEKDPTFSVDLKTVFSNLEQTGYIQKIVNLFRYFWKKNHCYINRSLKSRLRLVLVATEQQKITQIFAFFRYYKINSL